MELSEKIKNIRIAKNMTQEQLSELSGINIATISKYEIGMRKPKTDQLMKIANALGISIYVFMDFDINTVSDLLSLIFRMDEQVDMNFDAEKDSTGNYIPETVKLSFNSSPVNMKLCSYMSMLDRQSAYIKAASSRNISADSLQIKNVQKSVSRFANQLLDDKTPISKKSCSVLANYSEHRETENPITTPEDELTTILMDCSDKEIDFIIKTIGFLKKTLREQE